MLDNSRDEIRSQSTTSERWIPPSASRRDAFPENSNDVKYRKVRAILNKLTPQTFDKLSDEIINIGLDSQVLLKGVILLIFEKALQEPKYVCMYAQLCKRLNKKVPNFDPPNSESHTTFRRLLLLKCQDEYENRTRASAAFDNRTDLTPEEEEEKHMSKFKMLGNIKFIGELGKLEMLTHAILHRCCEELVKKTKAEDLECLCQIMSTCGKLLDNDNGKYLMDQYFARMKKLSAIDKLPSRIRFMLQDVIELRENDWHPRQTTSRKENPKSIDEIHREAKDELGIAEYPQADVMRAQYDASRRNNRFGNKKNRSGMEDVFGSFPVGPNLGTGPGVISLGDKPMPRIETNGYHHGNQMNNYRPGGMRYYQNNTQNNGGGYQNNGGGYQNNGGGYQNNGGGYQPQMKNRMNQYNNQQDYHQSPMNMHQNRNYQGNVHNGGYEKPAVAPRFMKQGGGHVHQMPTTAGVQGQGSMKEELSFRPTTGPMMKNLTGAGPIYIPNLKASSGDGQLTRPPPVASPDTAATAVDANNEAAKKSKGPTKDDFVKETENINEEFIQNSNEEEALGALKNLNIVEKYVPDVLTAVLNKAMDRNENEREKVFALIIRAVHSKVFSGTQLLDSYRSMLELMGDLEADIPRIKSYIAGYAAQAITAGITNLAEIAEPMEGGQHYPFLLLVLQHLSKSMDKIELTKMFDDSKINLLNTLPKTDRTKERMADILEERELSFLFPLLKIQAEMTKQLQVNPDVGNFFEWIKNHVNPNYHAAPGFITALTAVVVKFVTAEVKQHLGSEPTEKATKEKERELLLKFKPIFNKFLMKVDLQVIAIYALQSTWCTLGSPKVMLLRWFMNLYELEIIDGESFMAWKEDISDDYPGKGQALFQVNQWLLWLEEAEEDDDEEGDEDQ